MACAKRTGATSVERRRREPTRANLGDLAEVTRARPRQSFKRLHTFCFDENSYSMHYCSQEHESFIYNIAMNRLDVYTFDLWNMNECRCGKPQEALEYCDDLGYYRWNINVVSWMRKPGEYLYHIPSFDEPHVSMIWPAMIPPHRAGVVGESLFVHAQYITQRDSAPDFGLIESVLLPWYTELAAQYTAAPYGGWAGNRSLLTQYEDMQAAAGEKRFSVMLHWRCGESEWQLEREFCPPNND